MSTISDMSVAFPGRVVSLDLAKATFNLSRGAYTNLEDVKVPEAAIEIVRNRCGILFPDLGFSLAKICKVSLDTAREVIAEMRSSSYVRFKDVEELSKPYVRGPYFPHCNSRNFQASRKPTWIAAYLSEDNHEQPVGKQLTTVEVVTAALLTATKFDTPLVEKLSHRVIRGSNNHNSGILYLETSNTINGRGKEIVGLKDNLEVFLTDELVFNFKCKQKMLGVRF